MRSTARWGKTMLMKEIALHIMDIAQNSISAGATLIEIEVIVDHERDAVFTSVKDNGCGMDEETVGRVVSPFETSRTTRKVGLGIPFFKMGAEECGGSFELSSKPGEGTYISASYAISNIDRPPLGDMAETMLALAACNEGVDFLYRYTVDGNEFVFDTREIRCILGEGIPLNLPDIMAWMREYLDQGIEELNGGI